jgi:FixJ family two-component response regulator
MASKRVFIVSKDPAVRDSISELLASANLPAETLSSMEAWVDAAGPDPRGCLVLDTGTGELDDPARLARFASACARLPVLVLTDRGDVPMAVQAIKRGATDVLQKPFRGEYLLERIKAAVSKNDFADAEG